MAQDDPVAASLKALTMFLVGDASAADPLQRIIDLAVVAVPPAAYTGISMLVEDKVTTSVFSDPEVLEMDQAQYAAGTGPCLDAFRHGIVYTIPSTSRDSMWPRFSRAALAHGIGSTLSLPLLVGEAHLGALNFYATAEEAFSHSDQEAAEAFAAPVAVVLANAQAYWDARALSEQLGEA